MQDILTQIVEQRRKDIESLGFAMGFSVPEKRGRKIYPFLFERGAILEVKRASPSKGDIAPGLDAAATAMRYEKAGAGAISVLTERHWFKGGLDDLQKVSSSVECAVLRKDFLLEPEEIDVAFNCGADAVLLIARILDKEQICRMAGRCAALGIRAFVEVRLESDVEKLLAVFESYPDTVVAGVNSRDLSDFTIDPLKPAEIKNRIDAASGNMRIPVVYESGLTTKEAVRMAGNMGFHGILLGEAAARNPAMAKEFVCAFKNAGENAAGDFWNKVAARVHNSSVNNSGTNNLGGKIKPLVKICGLTNKSDALLAASLGADMLGFIFCKKSPRNVDAASVREIADSVKKAENSKDAENSENKKSKRMAPLLIGVITEQDSEEARAALSLLKDGVLGGIQFHGVSRNIAPEIPGYTVLNITSDADIEKLKQELSQGQPRVLIDAKAGEKIGGTGKSIEESLVKKCAALSKVWLAGGIGADNVCPVIEKFSPELIDVSSALESAPGKKDSEKLERFFSMLFYNS